MLTSTFCSFALAGRGKPTHHLSSGCVVAELREALKKCWRGPFVVLALSHNSGFSFRIHDRWCANHKYRFADC